MTHNDHLWVVGNVLPATLEREPGQGRPIVASANRRLRGPYTAAGEVARQLAPTLLTSCPQHLANHDVEVLAVAPDLRSTVVNRRPTLTTTTSPQNRTRYYPRDRTTRLAHGLTELVIGACSVEPGGLSLVVTDAEYADSTDVEWLGILLRRLDASLCRVVVHSRTTDLPDPLRTSLRRHATLQTLSDTWHEDGSQDNGLGGSDLPHLPLDLQKRAEAYVDSDCTAPITALRQAYDSIEPTARQRLHDARADHLEGLGLESLCLGAIPFHRERGSDPTGAGADVLLHAIEHCVLEGFYDAVIELGSRCYAVLDWETRPEDCWLVTAKVTTALTALDRADEAESFYDRACASTTSPSVHLQSAYGRAMLFTRFFTADRRNHAKAKAWVNTAISISSLLPDDQRRAFNLTFNENGLALVEMHLGDLAEARRLVETGMARLDAETNPGDHSQHRAVLAYNLAQLLAVMGPPQAALAQYATVIESDPHHSEYYFERASLLRKMGRYEEAMADYEAAIRESPPYPEPHYNRGDLAAQLGDVQTALSEFSYVLDLEPTFVDAYASRAALRLQLGDVDGTEDDVVRGLALEDAHPRLLLLKGLVAQERGRVHAAKQAFDAALALQPDLPEALASRAVLAFDSGDVQAAVDDLTRALKLTDDPTIRENRALALEHMGRFREAVEDCDQALLHPDADRLSLTELRERCLARLQPAVTAAPRPRSPLPPPAAHTPWTTLARDVW